MALVALEGVTKTVALPDGGDLTILRGVDLAVEPGEHVSIVGRSGSGKSTLLNVLGLLDAPSSGVHSFDGVDVATLRSGRRDRLRGEQVGFIFQQFNLLQGRTALENVMTPLLQATGRRFWQRRRLAAEMLERVGLGHRVDVLPHRLSGGEQQRVAIARALATDPAILLADEATSALDPETTADVVALLRRVNAELGVTILVITHEMEVVKSLADRVVVMERGRVVEAGSTFDVFAQPSHPATQRFVRTLVDDVPDARAVAHLRERHDGRLVTVSFRDESVSQSRVFAELVRRDVEFELVFGGIEDVQGRAFGHLTLELRGDDAAVEDAVRRIAELVTVTDVPEAEARVADAGSAGEVA